MGTVKFPEGMDASTTIEGDDKLMIAKATTGEAMQATFDSAKQYLNITSIEVKAVAGGATEATAVVLTAGPAGQVRKMSGVTGWFKNATGAAWLAPTTNDNSNWWDGTTWSLGSSVPLPEATADGKVAVGDSKAVSGNEVFIKSLTKEIYIDGNEYDPTTNINGFYIQASNGALTNIGGTSYVISKINSCVAGDDVYFINWNRNTSFCVRFLDSSNSPLKPLKSDGTPFTLYSDQFDSPIKAPVGSVGYQFTVKFNNVGDQTNLVVNKTGTEKEAIRNDFINANAKVEEDDTNPLSGDTAAKILVKKSDIIVGENMYDYTKDISGSYINTTTGDLVVNATAAISEIIDVSNVSKVIIQNRLGNSAYRFLSPSGIKMKALDKNGVVFPSYAGPLNGEFYKPSGAVGFQFTTMFNNTTSRNITVVNEDGYLKPQIHTSLIPEDTSGKMWVSKSGNNIAINGFNSNGTVITNNIVFRAGANTQNNPNFNMVSDYIGGVYFKDSIDDVTPVNLFNNAYIGGNHGWKFAFTISKTGHGKTVGDIGSVYNDSLNRDFVIVNVPDANNIIVCGRNLATDGYSYTFPEPTGTLTYKSNGSNTGDIASYTPSAINNLYNFVKLNVSKLLIDDKEVSTDGSFYGETIQVVEDYDVFDLDSVLAQLIAGRPSGGYTTSPNLNSFNATKLFNHSLIYEWKKAGKCLISHSFLVYKKLLFNFHGFIQAIPINNASAKIYIPKALPFGGVDYRLAPTYNTPAAPVHITKASYWEYPNNSPDRVLNFITGNYGIHLGYIKDMGDSVNRESLVDDAMFLQDTTKKIYPKGIDKIQVLDPGVTYSIVAFRNIVDLTNVGSVRTSLDITRADNALYVTVDYHKQGLDTIEIPDDFLGKTITVIESRKAVLYGKISSKVMRINSTADDYGFIKFKIK